MDRTYIFTGRVFSVAVEKARLPHGREVNMEIVEHPPSVVLIPQPDARHVVLVRQYRHAVGKFLWELPAGSVDPGETSEDAARRECHEEIGLVPTSIEALGTFLPTPGYCTEEMGFFRLTGLTVPQEAAAVDEDEDIETKTFSIDEVQELVRSGEIVDMKTAVGIWLLRERPG